MSRRTPGWSAVAIVAAVLVWSESDAWGLGFILGESKEQLKLKYDVVVEDNGTGRVTIVLTLADEGRLKPLDGVELYVLSKEKNKDGSSSMDLVVSIDMVKGEGGTRVGRVQILREAAERAQIWLNTHTMDGKLDADTRLHHVTPIAKYLKDALAAGEPAVLQPAKSDQERMVGNWFITNDDSMRKGEMWVITEDNILMHPMHGGLNAQSYFHRLDAGKDPRQIDITVTRVNGPTVGVIKGIYVIDRDELRLCLGGLDKDRPAAFPEKPGPGEVLILQRAISGASPLKAKAEQPAKSDQERMLGNWFLMNDDSMRKREMWVITEDSILMYAKHAGANAQSYSHRLDAGKDPRQIDITVTKVNGPPIGIMRGIYALDGDELRLCLGGLDKDRPAAFPKKPAPGEVLILQRATSGTSPPKADGGEGTAERG